MRTCIIFNPAAKGDKARRFRKHLDDFDCAFKATSGPGDAGRLAAEAVREGFETVVAAGGDGTVNEVLNGMAGVPGAFEQSRMGVIPLGTVNVFARELNIPSRVRRAWGVLEGGQEARIDLPFVEFISNRKTERRYFAQLAGAGLDARAVELVHWDLKKKVGALAYIIAGLKALSNPPSPIVVTADGHSVTGGLVLVGNGILYGGDFRVFPNADLQDGLLEIRVFPKVNWTTLARCGPQLLLLNTLPAASSALLRAPTFQLTSTKRTPLQVDGEFVGELPATFSVQKLGLRVIVPKAFSAPGGASGVIKTG